MIVKESIEFKRGQESKKGLDVGEYRSENQVIKKYLEETQDFYKEDAFEWISQCPPLTVLLEIKDVDDLKDIVSLETDYTSEMNDLDPDVFKDDFYPIEQHRYVQQNPRTTWTFTEGQTEDGSRVIHWQTGLTDGYIARKEWLK